MKNNKKSMITNEKPKMDPKIKNRWIKALLSGDYEQGKKCLKNKKGQYCCLGVLADVCDKLGRKNQFDDSKAGSSDGLLSYRLYDFAKEMGLMNKEDGRSIENKLVLMNDEYDSSFKQIAAWIKKNL